MKLIVSMLALGLTAWGCGAETADAENGGGGSGGNGGTGGVVVVVDTGVVDTGAGGETVGGSGGEVVVEVQLQGLEVFPANSLVAGGTHQFTAVAVYDDGSSRDVSAEVNWASDNADVLVFGDAGEASMPYGGTAEIFAEFEGVTSSIDIEVGCDYPAGAMRTFALEPGATMPPISWDKGFLNDGTEISFAFDKAFCAAEYKDVTAFVLIVNAEWCAPCREEMLEVSPSAAAIEAAGGKILYITIQDLNGSSTDADHVQRYISRLIGQNTPGIRLASDSNPDSFFDAPSILQFFPTSFVFRKRDMKMIADSRAVPYRLAPFFTDIVSNVDANWNQENPPNLD